MKIGFNVKKIINAFQESINHFSSKVVQNENNIANHETRITTLENSPGGGGGSTVGGSSEIKTCNFTLYDVSNQVRNGYEIKCINKTIFLDVYFTFLLGEFDYTNIDNNRIKIGTCTMTDDNHIINTYSSIPVVYQIENSNVKYNGNLKIEYDESNNGRNNIELVINTEDVQTIKNKKVEQIEGRTLMIDIIGGGLFNDNIYIP